MTGREWPAWLDALRPDDVTRERLRRMVVEDARPLLSSRRGSWVDLASRWATLLSPIAAAVTLVFAGLAILQSPGREPLADRIADPPAAGDPLLESPVPAVPAAFTDDSIADLDLVLTAIASED